ncbi:Ubiquitin-activating enzyme, putative [Hondaea fermentalgiana]|uniref:Ubiquitin-activating enzyme, putative n=1 Tax=Hondaea fermentalgiana TaxID=2315210 RepID=A0A2R5G6H7_9STRA|nr:Ubiquitin-activating enzyme, putative [Hondaea fermentalgiana]|eukprot:GBG26662.1 Ubiquitin-activating enzyme, putative [Hondaea fermentalgiana]
MSQTGEAKGAMNEQLYSRQLFVLGREAQERLQSCRVALAGEMNGLAVEIAKNVMLAGVNALTLVDEGAACQAGDLAANFFVSEEDVRTKRGRVEAVVEQLRELNALVSLETMPVADFTLDDAGMGRFDVVILVNGTRARAEAYSSFCHTHDPKAIAFIAAGSYGVYGYTFSDFGPEFTVVDPDGELNRQGIVLEVKASEDGKDLIVLTADDRHHGLEDGDFVRFRGVGGLEALNDGEPRRVRAVQIPNADGKTVDGLAFAIERGADSLDAGAYTGGGHFEQVKTPRVVAFAPLAETLADPPCVQNDWTDFSRPAKLHAFLLKLWAFQNAKGRLPRPGDQTDASELAAIDAASAGAGASVVEAQDGELCELLGRGAAGQINPMAAFLGGVAAQEVLKACSGKFTPLQQWLHVASPESLPVPEQMGSGFPSLEDLSAHALETPDARYCGQAAVFGWDFQARLGALKVFVVGAGALGCETLKNMALMGVACKSKGGALTVTDMDAIELSNLNRQFLFRSQHIGKMKSVVAADQARNMNPDFEVKAMESKVAPDTENLFNDAFWAGMDIVVNALDNVTARLYVDSKCVFHGKPLLESGTLGTKANTLPVVPNLTESYGSDPVQDEGGEDIPACTLHAYPNLIEHTLAWARDAVFEKFFNLEPAEGREFLEAGSVEAYTAEANRQPNTKLARVRTARAVLRGPHEDDHPEKLFPYNVDLSPALEALQAGNDKPLRRTCVELARMRFEELFVNKIAQLLHAHPLDKTVDDQGTLFWSGKRRPPKLETFTPEDPLHIKFVLSAASLFAQVYGGVDPPLEVAEVREILSRLDPLPSYEADDSVAVPENDEEAKKLQKEEEERAKAASASTSDLFQAELAKLTSSSVELPKAVHPQVFEKDFDLHMDVVYAAAAIRARSYSIPLVDQLEAKRIVGRIIPAIATTTAATTGAVALELYKFLHEGSPSIERFRAMNMNLATNSYASFEPTPCKTRKFGKEHEISLWTMVNLRGNRSVQEILDYFMDEYSFEVNTISTDGDVTLYNDLFGQEDRLETPIADLYRTVVGKEPPYFIMLNVDGDFDEDYDDDEEDDDDEDGNFDEDEDEIVPPACRIDWQAQVGEDED